MRAIRPVLRLWKLAYLSWALREIHPLHPDLPALVLAKNELERPL